METKIFTTKDFRVENKLLFFNPTLPYKISLVCFYTSTCPACKNLLRMWPTLVKMIGNCNFIISNLLENPKIRELSYQTTIPFDEVPLLFLYFNQTPAAKYIGNFEVKSIVDFVMGNSQKLQARKPLVTTNTFTPINETNQGRTLLTGDWVPPRKEEQKSPSITGIPFCDGKTCYLPFNQAYKTPPPK